MGIGKGGSFLVNNSSTGDVFTPEDFTEEHVLIGKTALNFVEKEVAPQLEKLEQLDCRLMKSLLFKAGELGLLSADIPEVYAGMGLDMISSINITENIVKGGSFALAQGAHTGIGSLPIVYFGTKEQKERYLPLLATGEKVAAYALTEPGSGSDALSARTKAILSPDGSYYLLNGTKQFITNAGLADVFVTYAQINGSEFSAFIVDREAEGVSVGIEEKKMGIKGSSTCSVIFEDAKIPVGNLLGEIGKGHVIAFNILNIGRFKLAAGCVGTAKLALEESLGYAAERIQFNLPLTSFGLIKEKLAGMATRIYFAESMVYRTAGLIENRLEKVDMESVDSGRLVAAGIAEYAIECSVNKIFGSEVLDFVVDEAVQIHGGYGFIQEYPVERFYRDSRINRIFEGTNEINRLLIPATIIRKAMQGELPLLAAVQHLGEDLLAMFPALEEEQSLFGREEKMLEMSRKIFLLCAGAAVKKFGENLRDRQYVLARLADMVIEIFALESGLLRTKKTIERKGEEGSLLKILMTRYYFALIFPKMDLLARETLAAIDSGDMLKTQLAAQKKLARHMPLDQYELIEKISEQLSKIQHYCC